MTRLCFSIALLSLLAAVSLRGHVFNVTLCMALVGSCGYLLLFYAQMSVQIVPLI